MNQMVPGDADSILHKFERYSEELAILEKYGVFHNRSIGLAINMVKLDFETNLHSSKKSNYISHDLDLECRFTGLYYLFIFIFILFSHSVLR